MVLRIIYGLLSVNLLICHFLRIIATKLQDPLAKSEARKQARLCALRARRTPAEKSRKIVQPPRRQEKIKECFNNASIVARSPPALAIVATVASCRRR